MVRAKVCKDVDLELLDAAISQFEKEHFVECYKNQYNYIIMSEDTNRALFYITEYKSSVTTSNSYKMVKEYKGNRIAIDNGIPYGRVEIR